MITPTEAADIVRTENGNRTIGEVGRDGLGELLWDACPEYQRMSPLKRARFREAVAEEIFG